MLMSVQEGSFLVNSVRLLNYSFMCISHQGCFWCLWTSILTLISVQFDAVRPSKQYKIREWQNGCCSLGIICYWTSFRDTIKLNYFWIQLFLHLIKVPAPFFVTYMMFAALGLRGVRGFTCPSVSLLSNVELASEEKLAIVYLLSWSLLKMALFRHFMVFKVQTCSTFFDA